MKLWKWAGTMSVELIEGLVSNANMQVKVLSFKVGR